MTQLHPLRYQLSALRRARQTGRWVAVLAAMLVAVAWTLGVVFVLDYGFALDVVQRVIVLAIGVGAVVWAWKKFATPFVNVQEDEYDMALMVERQQRINSDLIAAMQFESTAAATWGSGQLRQRVIDFTASLSRGLDVFEGFSRPQMARRLLTLVATTIVAGSLIAGFPDYAKVFADRLLLGSRHYPTATTIEQIVINGDPVLLRRRGDETQPTDTRGAQGRPVSLTVQCTGRLPDEGKIRITSVATGNGRPLELTRLSLDDRRSRLTAALKRLRELSESPEADPTGLIRHQIAAAIQFDAPEPARLLADPSTADAITDDTLQEVESAIRKLPEKADDMALFTGELPTILDELKYQVFLGDAWTDPARIQIIPMPVVELRMTPVPPKYATAKPSDAVDPTARQISVLEGSRVDLSLQCTNGKRLKDVWLVVAARGDTPRKRFAFTEGEKGQWRLNADDSPFTVVREEVRFELQVTDEHNLHLEAPIRGYIRLKADRPPTGALNIVHRVVVPAAKPRIDFRAMDDYGIGKLVLQVQVERVQDKVDDEPTETDPAEPLPEKKKAQLLPITLPVAGPVMPDKLPLFGRHVLDLAGLRLENGETLPLVKGDRLKLQLEVTDYRGDLPGETFLADPLVLEISDDAGVLQAIAEADERSEKQLSDIISKELGIGESP